MPGGRYRYHPRRRTSGRGWRGRNAARPFPGACGREARHYFRRPCPDRLAGRGGQLLTQYVEGDTRSLGEFLHPLVHGQRRAYETDLPEHLPYPPGVGSAFPPRRLPDAVAQVIHRLCPHEPAQRLGPLPAEHLVRSMPPGRGRRPTSHPCASKRRAERRVAACPAGSGSRASVTCPVSLRIIRT